MTDSLVTVAAFQSANQAQAAQFHLESEGIGCYLDGLEVVGTDWGISNAIGNIRVQTRSADLIRAREVLDHRVPSFHRKADGT